MTEAARPDHLPPSPPAPRSSTTDPRGAGADLPQGAVQACLGPLRDRDGPGRRPAAFLRAGSSGRQDTRQPQADVTPSSSQGPAVLRPGRCRLLPRPAARASRPGRPAREHPVLEDADRGDRPRQDLRGGPDLRPLGLRQVVAGQGGPAAPAGEVGARGLRRGDRRRDRSPAPAGLAASGCPELPDDLGLVEAFAPAAAGRCFDRRAEGRCSCWTSSSSGCTPGEPRRTPSWSTPCGSATAGELQAIVMVRDDFWMAATRFMRELEIRDRRGPELRDGRSLRPPPRRQGPDRSSARPSAALPDQPGDLHRRAEGVPRPRRPRAWRRTARSSRSGWPCSPRWSRASPGPRPPCEEVGGTEGVGVTFLEETFSWPHGQSRSTGCTRRPPGRS